MDATLPSEVAGLLTQARAARRRLDPDRHLELVAEMEGELGGLAPGPARDLAGWAVTAERLRDIGYYETDEASLQRSAERGREGLRAIGAGHPDIVARLRLGLGQVAARVRGRGWDDEATTQLTAAARHFIDAGEREEAAAALNMLAWSVQLTGGGLLAALDSLTQALELSPDPSMRAGVLSHRSQVQLWLGRLDDAQADIEAAWSLTPQSDDRAVAYCAWSAACVASLRGHRAVVEDWVRRGDERRGGFADNNVTGLWFDAMVTDALARVGAVEAARERLERVTAQADIEPTPAGIARVAVEARWGDPHDAAEAWEAVRTRPDIEPWEVARLRLLVAQAASRHGGDPGRIAAEAFDLCAGLEEPAVLLTIEPDAARQLLPAAAAAGSTVAARLLRQHPRWHVRVLGGLTVRGPDGAEVPLAGHIRRLVLRLAIAAAPVTREEIGGWLWPDTQADLGGRLRQLLHRARSLLPRLIETDGQGRVCLADDVAVDLHHFDAAVQRALASSDEVLRGVAAREALSHVGGELLSEEVVDADWLDELRSRCAADLAWVHGVLAQQAHDEGQDGLALDHARAALQADPTHESAAVLAIDLLRQSGQRAQARSVLEVTLAALAVLDLQPGAALSAAQARLT